MRQSSSNPEASSGSNLEANSASQTMASSESSMESNSGSEPRPSSEANAGSHRNSKSGANLTSNLTSIIATTLYYPMYFSIVLLWTISMVSAGKSSLRTRLKISRFYYKLYEICLRWLCGIKTIYDYRGQLPTHQPYVIMANHESAWDAFNLASLNKSTVTTLKKELVEMPVVGWSFALLDPIILDRDNLMQSMKKILIQGQKALQDGYSLLIFPQGQRSILPKVDKFSSSAINISWLDRCPLVPVAHNAGERIPYKNPRIYPGTSNIIIGEAFDPQQYETKAAFRAAVMSKMKEMIKEAHQTKLIFED